MTLRELEDEALKLSVEERWQLINTLIRSVQQKPQSVVKLEGLAASLIGIAKTFEQYHEWTLAHYQYPTRVCSHAAYTSLRRFLLWHPNGAETRFSKYISGLSRYMLLMTASVTVSVASAPFKAFFIIFIRLIKIILSRKYLFN